MSCPNAALPLSIMKISMELFLFMFVISCCVSFRKLGEVCRIGEYMLNGICIECPTGFYGVNCSHKCPAGLYGKHCLESCACIVDQICDHIHGCTVLDVTECPDGFHGPDCLYECPAGYYGKGCTQECDCKTEQMCDPKRGCVGTNDTGNSTIIPDEHSGHSMVRYWLFLVLAFGGGASLVSIIFSLCYYRRRFCGRREEQNQEGAIVRPEIELDCVQIENAEYDDVGEPEPIYVVIDENE